MQRAALCIFLLVLSQPLIAQEPLSKPLLYNWSKPLAYDVRFELTEGAEQNALGLQFYLEGRSQRKRLSDLQPDGSGGVALSFTSVTRGTELRTVRHEGDDPSQRIISLQLFFG